MYGVYADMLYSTMCSPTQISSIKRTPIATSDNLSGQVSGLSNNTYLPPNVNDNTPFTGRFSVGYLRLSYALDTNITRYVYELTLPAGLSVAATPNLRWFKGMYPENSTSAPLTPGFSQTGNVITITSPDSAMGYFMIDLVYTCGAGGQISIPLKLKRIDDVTSPQCSCNTEIFCSNAIISNAICVSACTTGPSISSVRVERADNSLGWTDNTLTTIQSRSSITASF